MLTHTGAKPHKCEGKDDDGTACGKAFARSGTLGKHMQRFHK